MIGRDEGMPGILAVDDEQEIADFVELSLRNDGFAVYKCYEAQQAMRCIEST